MKIQNNTQNHRVRLKHIAIEVALLTRSDLSYFFNEMLNALPSEKKDDVIEYVAGSQFKYGGKWTNIDKWMTSCFTKHYDYSPLKVARMGLKYWHIAPTMEPLLIKLAQKAKDRVRKKRAYASTQS